MYGCLLFIDYSLNDNDFQSSDNKHIPLFFLNLKTPKLKNRLIILALRLHLWFFFHGKYHTRPFPITVYLSLIKKN